MSRLLTMLLTVAAAALLAGCGEDERPADNAVEAQEQNVVELGGVRYRVITSAS